MHCCVLKSFSHAAGSRLNMYASWEVWLVGQGDSGEDDHHSHVAADVPERKKERGKHLRTVPQTRPQSVGKCWTCFGRGFLDTSRTPIRYSYMPYIIQIAQ